MGCSRMYKAYSRLMQLPAGCEPRADGHERQSGDGHRRQQGEGHERQPAGLVKDRLLVAANAALASLAGNADTHFAMVNEGAAPALVAALQYGTSPCIFRHSSIFTSSMRLFYPKRRRETNLRILVAPSSALRVSGSESIRMITSVVWYP